MAGVYLSIVWQYKDLLRYRLDYLLKIMWGVCPTWSSRKNGISRYQVTTNPEAQTTWGVPWCMKHRELKFSQPNYVAIVQ